VSKNSQDLLDDLIQLHKDKPEFTELYLKKMAVTNFGAGHETLASTLTAVLSMFGTHPDIQEQSRQEIIAHHTNTNANPPSFSAAAANLPLTHAVIRESMRLYPVIAMSLPRRVPNSPLHIHGYTIPSGTTVGCNPVALHRNEDICGPHGDSFEPARWLNDGTRDDECSLRTRTLERYNLSWGGGSRTCPGKYLAELIVLKVVTRLVEEFEVRANVPPDADCPSYFLSMLTGVRASFLPRTQTDAEGALSARKRRTGVREVIGL
jgi:cytochrome P450